MGRIKVLEQDIASKISAGEVVERPLSVVKELVENSIDAKAKRIEIGIEDGGKKLIYVKDDGHGMDAEDLAKCLFKHATSKIETIYDLFNIKSLGFRGEALFSISQVSELTIRSKTENQTIGYELKSIFGRQSEIYEAGSTTGTFVIVKDLFKNVPARKKFLKSSLWEKSLILEYIEGIAILYPHIEIIFIDEGKHTLLLKSTASREERIYQIFPELYGKLYTGSIKEGNYIAYAYLSMPDIKMTHFNVFAVNHRFVKDRLFYKVLQDFYGEQRKKSSFVTILLELPENEVDVNVHPTKKEVKFHKTSEVYNVLRELLEKATLSDIFNEKTILPFFENNKVSEEKMSYGNRQSQYDESIIKENNIKVTQPKYHLIGTFCDGYLLIEKDQTLYIIDQHAAHERLIYNKIIDTFLKKHKESQKIIPYVITAKESKKIQYEHYRDFLENVGFEFEDSGPNNIVLTAIPAFLSFETAIDIFTNFFKDIDALKRKEDLIKSFASTTACKEAVKKTTKLTVEEIDFLIQSFENKEIEAYCPHGRNFAIKITLQELEKKFGRNG